MTHLNVHIDGWTHCAAKVGVTRQHVPKCTWSGRLLLLLWIADFEGIPNFILFVQHIWYFVFALYAVQPGDQSLIKYFNICTSVRITCNSFQVAQFIYSICGRLKTHTCLVMSYLHSFSFSIIHNDFNLRYYNYLIHLISNENSCSMKCIHNSNVKIPTYIHDEPSTTTNHYPLLLGALKRILSSVMLLCVIFYSLPNRSPFAAGAAVVYKFHSLPCNEFRYTFACLRMTFT